jgi:hypothetical protein
LRKGLARFVVVFADEESDVQLGISRKRLPIAKPTTPRHFSTASTHLGHRACIAASTATVDGWNTSRSDVIERASGLANVFPNRRADEFLEAAA